MYMYEVLSILSILIYEYIRLPALPADFLALNPLYKY